MADISSLSLGRRRTIGCALRVFVAALAIGVTHLVYAEVNYDGANDYYQALAAGRVKVVDQFHLGPCEQSLRERNYPKAAADCVFILNIFPNHPRALFLIIQICDRWKSPQCRSEDFLDKAIAINPRASATFVMQGIFLHQTRRYPQAIDSFRHALQIDPNSTNAHYDLGLTYLETKQYELANEEAQAAYTLGTSLPALRDRLQKTGHWKPLEQNSIPGVGQEPSGVQGLDKPMDELPKK